MSVMSQLKQQNQLQEGITKQQSKRINTPVCTFCKKRKIKCDRKTPCSSCLRYDNHDCVYGEHTKTRRPRKPRTDKVSSGLDNELHSLREKLSKAERMAMSPEDYDASSSENGSVYDKSQESFTPYRDDFGVDSPEDSFFGVPFVALMARVENDNVNLHHGFSSLYEYKPFERRHYGLFAWKSLLTVDPTLKLVLDFVYQRTRSKPRGVDSDANVLDDSRESFNNNSCNNSCNKNPVLEADFVTSRISNKAKAQGLFHLDKAIESKLELISKIELVLPIKHVAWEFIDRFFLKLYLFFPYLDEQEFKDNMERLIGSRTFDANGKITIEIGNKNDFSYLGILLIIVRLGYLSMLTGFEGTKVTQLNTNDVDSEYLLNNPVTIETYDVAQECLKQFDLLGTINLTIFQLALYIRIYQIYAPEFGDGPDSGNSQVFNAMLFQLAYSLGLHREPDRLPGANNEKGNNMGRKIWHGLLMMDLGQGLDTGDPLNGNKFPYDIKLPFYKPGNSNLLNNEKEKLIGKCFEFMKNSYKPVSGLLTNVLSFTANCSISSICHQIRHIKNEVFGSSELADNFNSGKSFLAGERQLENVLAYKLELQVSCFLCSLYFYLFNFLERKGNYKFSYYYLVRLFDRMLLMVLPFIRDFTNNQMELDVSAGFIFMPVVEQMIHKSLIFILSLMVRIKISAFNCNANTTGDHDQKLNKLNGMITHLVTLSETLLKISSRFSNRYYYSWIISRLQKHFLTVAKSDSLEGLVYDKNMEFELLTRHEYLDQLIEILAKSNELFEKKENQTHQPNQITNNYVTIPDLESDMESNSHTESSQETDTLWLYLKSAIDKSEGQDITQNNQNVEMSQYGDPFAAMENDNFLNSFVVDEIFRDMQK